jgi:hypothetical protein
MHPSCMPCVPRTAWINNMHEEPAQWLARFSDWVSSLIFIYPNHSPYLSAKQQLQASLIVDSKELQWEITSVPCLGLLLRTCKPSKLTLSRFFFSSSWPCMPFRVPELGLHNSSESQALFRTGILCSPGLPIWLCLIKAQLCSQTWVWVPFEGICTQVECQYLFNLSLHPNFKACAVTVDLHTSKQISHHSLIFLNPRVRFQGRLIFWDWMS